MSAADPLTRAYQVCEALARSHYENFPVASRLLPRAMRPHVAAVYAFARVADDIADEGAVPADERQRRLGGWRERLHRAAGDERFDRSGDPLADQIFLALGHSIRTLDLPVVLFDNLLSAFGQDIVTTRYASWTDLLDYCRRSANPVGRLVLRIAGYSDALLEDASDAMCTALQLTNFWQDLGRDWRAGRLYVPREVQQACGTSEAALAGGALTPEWRDVMARCAGFTRGRFADGRGVCDGVRGRLRYELRLTWLGGVRILERVEHGSEMLLAQRPSLARADLPALAWRAARWSRS